MARSEGQRRSSRRGSLAAMLCCLLGGCWCLTALLLGNAAAPAWSSPTLRRSAVQALPRGLAVRGGGQRVACGHTGLRPDGSRGSLVCRKTSAEAEMSEEETRSPNAKDTVFNVKVPAGATAGSEVKFMGPDDVERFVKVPQGYGPGQRFKVEDASWMYVEECSLDQPSLCEGAGEIKWLDDLNHKLELGLGSAILLVASLISLYIANSSSSAGWLAFWNRQLEIPFSHGHMLSYRGWINEGLMSMFFFAVGLEIKKELVEGSLSSTRKALLPCIAALGGMVVPMAVYVLIQNVMPGGSYAGITVPMATDIAFAMGVFYSLRQHMPKSASSFLLALATVDDIGAIIVIAVVFASHISASYLFAAAVTLISTILATKKGVASGMTFLVPGFLMWYFLLMGGINADIAGVVVALCVPMKSTKGAEIVERLIGRWSPASALIILPLFALANCAVPLGAGAAATGRAAKMAKAVTNAVPYGVALGLLVGKPLGIFGFSWLAMKANIASMPQGMSNRHLGIVGVLGSIGFTMCIFLIENSLTGKVAHMTKVAVFIASVVGAVGGAALMKMQPARNEVDAELAMA